MASKRSKRRHSALSMGVELETYSVGLPEARITREIRFPKRSLIEEGERFTKDLSIGSEYNSKVFTTIREAFFLLKSSLRKYTSYQSEDAGDRFVIFPIGGWTDRFAGSHIHLGLGKERLRYEDAKKLATQLHDHIPFLIALSGNSPIWRGRVTPYSSNRLLRGSDRYCKVTRRGTLYKHHYREMTFNQGGKTKPPTLELRVCDSSIPEYLVAVLCICRAVALRWLKSRREDINSSTHTNYLRARDQAVRVGPRAKLVWTNHRLRVPEYVDLFFRKYQEELAQMDIPDEILRIFKYLKKGWNQADVIRKACDRGRRRHPPTWERQFARRYAGAIEELLDGNTFEQFSRRLGVKLPGIDRVWLGRKESKW